MGSPQGKLEKRGKVAAESRLAGAIRAVMADVEREAEAGLQPVLRTRLKRSVVASLAFLEEAVVRAHLEIRKPHPNAVAVQLGGKAAVAVLQGTGVLQQFHVVDGRTLDVAGLADVVARAEILRQGLVERAERIASESVGESVSVSSAEESVGVGEREEERARQRVGDDPAAEDPGAVTPPHLAESEFRFSEASPILAEPNLEFSEGREVSRETKEGGSDA